MPCGQENPEDRHLPLQTMARLRSGALDAEEALRHVVPHLLSHCPGCRAVDEELQRLKREVGHWDELVVDVEWREAPDLWRELEPLPYRDQLAAIETGESMQTWGLCRLLQRRSLDAARERPEVAAQLASLALAISMHLAEVYHLDWVQDLRALCWSCLGNARRALGELHGAAQAFDAAALLRRDGLGYAAFEAEGLTLEALLRRDQHRLGEAVALFDRAYAIYAGVDSEGAEPEEADPKTADLPLAGSVLAHKAWCLYHLGQPEPALALLEEAKSLIDENREPRLAFAVRHGQVWAAISLGRMDDAEARLPAAFGLAETLGATPPLISDVDRLRLRRAEARLDFAMGETAAAKQTLLHLIDELLALDQGVDAGLAFLDLAAHYLQTDAGAALRQLATEMLPVFSAPDLARLDIYALMLLQQACETGRLTPELARQIASMLESHRRPSLAWWSGSGTRLFQQTDAPPPT